MEIREVEPDEYGEAGRVTALAYQEYVPPQPDKNWQGYLVELGDVAGRAERTIVLVAVEDGRIVGSATIETSESIDGEVDLRPGQANFRMLGVDPAARGRGTGRRLVQACIDRARAEGKTLLTLHTTEPMKPAQRLYESMGFRLDPERDLWFGDGFHLIAYRLELAPPPG
jgi:ribosomal protein S18 acetylase RimI-like enzyme